MRVAIFKDLAFEVIDPRLSGRMLYNVYITVNLCLARSGMVTIKAIVMLELSACYHPAVTLNFRGQELKKELWRVVLVSSFVEVVLLTMMLVVVISSIVEGSSVVVTLLFFVVVLLIVVLNPEVLKMPKSPNHLAMLVRLATGDACIPCNVIAFTSDVEVSKEKRI